ncbi:MAG: VWA domain-containing protein [Acidobacteria bacterium]|nr:VWA domain-containing protein [Acidobacteriota bacterium]
MRIRLLPLVLIVAAATVTAQPVFRSGVDLVSVGVTVLDRKGTLVTGLTADDFEVYEDGERQRLELFVGAAGQGAPLPDRPTALHLGLMLDASGSMQDDIASTRTAAIKFLNLLPRADDITVVDFDTEVRVARYGQNDFPRLVERIRSRKADGFTALYDAIGVYLDGAAELDGEKVLVLYSDGDDTRSSLNVSEIVTLLKASDVTLYAIGYLDNQSSSSKLTFRMRLQQLAEATGGRALFSTSIKDLDTTYAQILDEINARYMLGYLSTNTRADGTWREVEIRLVRPELKGAKLRTRKGYFAPYKP